MNNEGRAERYPARSTRRSGALVHELRRRAIAARRARSLRPLAGGRPECRRLSGRRSYLEGGRRRGPPSRSDRDRSEEHTSDLQSLMRIPYAVFFFKKKNNNNNHKI